MSRVPRRVAVVLICLAAVAGFFRWPLSTNTLVARMNATLGAHAAYSWTRPGSATFALLPRPTLRVSGLELVGPLGRSLVAAPRAEIALSVSELAGARFVPATIILRSPTMRLNLDALPFNSTTLWPQSLESASHTLSNAPPFELRLLDGVARFEASSGEFDTLIEEINGVARWPAESAPLTLDVTAQWRGARASLSSSLDAPHEWLRGLWSPAHFALTAAGTDLRYDGQMEGLAQGLGGDVHAASQSTAALARMLGRDPPPFFPAGATTLSAAVRRDGGAIAFEDLKLTAGDQNFVGGLSVDFRGPRPSLSGTLASDAVDLKRLTPPSIQFVDSDGSWSARPFARDLERAADFDLRLSFGKATAGSVVYDDVALALTHRDGNFTASLLECGAFGGRARGDLSASTDEKGLSAHISMTTEGVDLGKISELLGRPGIVAQGRVEIDVSGSGATPVDWLTSTRGSALFSTGPGEFDGANLEEILRRQQRGSAEDPRGTRPGRTAFTAAQARTTFHGGFATFDEAQLSAPGFVVEGRGGFDLVRSRFEVELDATQSGADGRPTPSGSSARFELFGPWRAPTLRAFAGGG